MAEIRGEVRLNPSALRKFSAAEKAGRQSIVRSLNRAIAFGRTAGSKEIRKEVALKKAYVDERLVIVPATLDKPEARIKAKRRGMLLSRFQYREKFAKGKSGKRKRAGMSVTVTPGKAKNLRGGFLLKLKAGARKGSTNLGIAYHVKGPGNDVWVYQRGGKTYYVKVPHGPSVSQVFDSVRGDLAAPVRAKFVAESRRLLDLLKRGNG